MCCTGGTRLLYCDEGERVVDEEEEEEKEEEEVEEGGSMHS